MPTHIKPIKTIAVIDTNQGNAADADMKNTQ